MGILKVTSRFGLLLGFIALLVQQFLRAFIC